jgi:hypothetical protein
MALFATNIGNPNMATTSKQPDQDVQVLSPEEWYREFDALAWRLMNMSGEEFMRYWDAGEFDSIADAPGHRHIIFLSSFIPDDRTVR